MTAAGASNADVADAISHMPRLEILRSRAEWIANITSASPQKGEGPPEGPKIAPNLQTNINIESILQRRTVEYLDDADVVSGGTLTKHLANKTEKRAPAEAAVGLSFERKSSN